MSYPVLGWSVHSLLSFQLSEAFLQSLQVSRSCFHGRFIRIQSASCFGLDENTGQIVSAQNFHLKQCEAALLGFTQGAQTRQANDQESIQEILTHIEDQQHEKTIRALSLSLSMQMFGKEEKADTLVE